MGVRSALAFVLLAAALPAQDFRATLTGQVTDPSGAAIPNATVKATNVATNETKEVKTTAEGVYTIPYLDPGNYNVEVSAAGFQTMKREMITLQVAQKLNLGFQMKVGQATTEITVIGQQETIDTADASRGLVFDPIKVAQYPLNGRQTYMLMSLTPGVIFGQLDFGPGGFSGTRGWDVNSSYKINGARQGGNLFLLNGAPISDAGGSWQIAPNVEAVQEFKVMTNTYDAAYGRFQGGVVNTTLKSGTNMWHGDVFDFWRNRILDTNWFQSNYASQTKGYHNQHQFGGVVQGPLRKDQDFVMFSFEGWQEIVPFPPTGSNTPNMALRDGQRFSDFGITIYDPLTTHDCTAGSGAASTEPCSGSYGSPYWRSPFPGNVLPKNRISPIGQKILSYYPAETVNSVTNNFIGGNNSGRYWYNQPIVRWDHVFGVNDKFYALYTFQHGYEFRSTNGYPKPATGSGNFDNERTDNNLILDWTRVMSPTTVLDVRASWARFTQLTPGYNSEALKLTKKDFGMTKMPAAPTSLSPETVPGITLDGYSTIFGNGSPVGTLTHTSQWNFNPSVTMTRGSHGIRTGFEINYYIVAAEAAGNSNGNFTFGAGITRQASGRSLTATDSYTSIATTLLGIPTSGSISFNDTSYGTRPYYGFYWQDDWKVSPKLTVNLGLRYDVQVPAKERFNRANRSFDPVTKHPLSDQVLAQWAAYKKAYDATNPRYPYPAPPAVLTGQWLFAGASGAPVRFYDTDWTNFGPRIGLAYRVLPNTVIRAGFGAFYKSPTRSGSANGFSQSTSYTANLTDPRIPSACANNACVSGPPTGPYSLVDPYPQGLAVPLKAAGGAMTAVGNSVGFDSPHYKIPRTYQYSLGFQHQLPHAIVAEASFSGNMQIFETYSLDMNWPSGQAGLDLYKLAQSDATLFSTSLQNPFYGVLPVTSSRGAGQTISRSSLLGQFSLWNSSMTNNTMQGSRYRSDALHVKVEKRALDSAKAGIMTWVLSWTFGKEYEQNHRLDATWNTTQPLYYEISNEDRTHSFSFSGVWDLPIGKGKQLLNVSNRVADKIASNWRADWILTYVSGVPVGWPDLINYCGDWAAKTQDENHWFNNDKSCYVQQPSNHLRDLPDRFPGTIRQPTVPQLNAAIEKTINLSERYRATVRFEGFNVSNTPMRATPSTTLTSTDFGVLGKSQRNFPRFFQLAAKFYF